MQRRPQRELTRAALSFCLALLCLGPAAAAEPALRVDSVVTWEDPAPWFGGFSGAEVSPDGARLTVVSDRGTLVEADLLRDGGRLSGLRVVRHLPLRRPNREPFRNKKRDAESLAMDSRGTLFVAFEHSHHVARLDPDSGITKPLPRHPDFKKLPPNTGLEALAVHPNGRLFALPEKTSPRSRHFPLYTFDGSGWKSTANLPARGPFLPVGADFDGEGRLYLLERTVTPLGFRNRIRRFTQDGEAWQESILLTTPPGQYDNLEALSLWQDPEGQTRLLLMSDDNFFPLQRTEVIELVLAKPALRD